MTKTAMPITPEVTWQDGDWRVVGWITSGGYGHYVKASLGQGYVPAELAERDEEGLFEIEILGVRYPAKDQSGTSVRSDRRAYALLVRALSLRA